MDYTRYSSARRNGSSETATVFLTCDCCATRFVQSENLAVRTTSNAVVYICPVCGSPTGEFCLPQTSATPVHDAYGEVALGSDR